MDNEYAAESAEHLEEWNELMTIEDGEVNGVRIPRGVAITVGKEDAARLIETGKAELIEEDGAAEISVPEEDNLPEVQAMPVSDEDTKADATAPEGTQSDQSGEVPADANEEKPKFFAEDAGMSAQEMTADDSAPGAQDAPSAEDTQALDDSNDVTETDKTNPQK